MINELMNSSNNLINIQFILLFKVAFAILYRYLYGHAINKAPCSS